VLGCRHIYENISTDARHIDRLVQPDDVEPHGTASRNPHGSHAILYCTFAKPIHRLAIGAAMYARQRVFVVVGPCVRQRSHEVLLGIHA
jgi:hypothetical protein